MTSNGVTGGQRSALEEQNGRARSIVVIDRTYANGYGMAMGGRVGERGQITITKAIREQLGICAGDEVVQRIDDGRVIVEIVPARALPLDTFDHGRSRIGVSVAEP
jgi:AbrB family looped-hinge helix DNA binding protein